MKRYVLLLLSIFLLTIPSISTAGSAFHVGYSSWNNHGGYHTRHHVRHHVRQYHPVRYHVRRMHYRPHYSYHRRVIVRYNDYDDYGYGCGCNCDDTIYYRHISYRPANWNAHSYGAITRERYVSDRSYFYGGRW